MEQVGVMLTCDRCGRTQFLENSNTEATYISDIIHTGPNRNIYESWGVVLEDKNLCPECTTEYFRMVDQFMENKETVTCMNLDKDTIAKAYRSIENCLHKSQPPLR